MATCRRATRHMAGVRTGAWSRRAILRAYGWWAAEADGLIATEFGWAQISQLLFTLSLPSSPIPRNCTRWQGLGAPVVQLYIPSAASAGWTADARPSTSSTAFSSASAAAVRLCSVAEMDTLAGNLLLLGALLSRRSAVPELVCPGSPGWKRKFFHATRPVAARPVTGVGSGVDGGDVTDRGDGGRAVRCNWCPPRECWRVEHVTPLELEAEATSRRTGALPRRAVVAAAGVAAAAVGREAAVGFGPSSGGGDSAAGLAEAQADVIRMHGIPPQNGTMCTANTDCRKGTTCCSTKDGPAQCNSLLCAGPSTGSMRRLQVAGVKAAGVGEAQSFFRFFHLLRPRAAAGKVVDGGAGNGGVATRGSRAKGGKGAGGRGAARRGRASEVTCGESGRALVRALAPPGLSARANETLGGVAVAKRAVVLLRARHPCPRERRRWPTTGTGPAGGPAWGPRPAPHSRTHPSSGGLPRLHKADLSGRQRMTIPHFSTALSLRGLACDAERAGAAALPLLPSRPMRTSGTRWGGVGVSTVGAGDGAGGTNVTAASEAARLRSARPLGPDVKVMEALLAEDQTAGQRELLLRLLTRVPLLRNPSRQLPLLLARRHAVGVSPVPADSGSSVGAAADNGKKAGDLLPLCLDALFAHGTGAATGTARGECTAGLV